VCGTHSKVVTWEARKGAPHEEGPTTHFKVSY
jgi:hypothetical protein